jgi:hypothetical protein
MQMERRSRAQNVQMIHDSMRKKVKALCGFWGIIHKIIKGNPGKRIASTLRPEDS